MYRLVESIHIRDGQIRNLTYHNKRLNSARTALFDTKDIIDLRDYILIPSAGLHGSIKCRVLYKESIERIEFLRYTRRSIKSLQVIRDEVIDYRFKYENRTVLQSLFDRRKDHDDILIVQKGLIRDTYYCNVAFKREGQWYTPASPLLHGTMRQYLIDHKQIIPMDIGISELHLYDKIRLFNAMIDFGDLELDVDQIHF